MVNDRAGEPNDVWLPITLLRVVQSPRRTITIARPAAHHGAARAGHRSSASVRAGKAPGKLDYVHDIAYDPADGSLSTAEIKNWRVQKWVRTAP
jgi:hypothetical protein